MSVQPQYNLTLSVVGPIVPGQPLTFSWNLLAVPSEDTSIGKVSAKLFIDDQLLYQSPAPVPFYYDFIPIVKLLPDGRTFVTLEYIGRVAGENPPPIQPTGGVANELYKIGTHTLQLVVTGTGANSPGPWTAEATLNVIPENVDSSWWVWDPSPNPSWGNNNPYTVSGTFTNKSNWSNMTFNFNFIETEEDNGNTQNRGSGTQKVGPSENRQVFSNNITQNWEFLVKGAWIVDGPFDELFDYTVNFNLQDDYGNVYPLDSPDGNITSGTLVVDVSVAGWKQAAATAAMTAAVEAVYWLALAAAALAGIITAPAAPALAATAGGFYTAAGISGAVALDPPLADPRFNELVTVKYQKVPNKLLQTKDLSATASYLSAILKIMDQISILDSIHGKILGARVANAQNSFLMQVSAYQSIVNLTLSDFANLIKYAKEAQVELDKLANPTKRGKIFSEILKKGLTSKMRKLILEAGVPKSTVSNLEQVIKNLSKSEDISVSPIRTTMQILRLIREVQKSANEIPNSKP